MHVHHLNTDKFLGVLILPDELLTAQDMFLGCQLNSQVSAVQASSTGQDTKRHSAGFRCLGLSRLGFV